MKVDSKYDRFVGKIVKAKEVVTKIEDLDLSLKEHVLDDAADSSIIKEIEIEALKDNKELRVWFPTSVGTADYREDRINVMIEQDQDKNKQWRIVGFGIG